MKLKRRKSKPKKREGWKGYLQDLLSSHVRYWFNDFVNATCISCGETEPRMIRIHALFFCIGCFTRDFDYASKTKSEADNKMYEKYKEKYIRQLEDQGLLIKKGGGKK